MNGVFGGIDSPFEFSYGSNSSLSSVASTVILSERADFFLI